MYMTGSKRKSHTSSETSTIIMPTPPPKKTRHVIYRTPSPIKRKRISDTPETPTIVSESPLLDDLSDYLAPVGTPEQPDEREHIYIHHPRRSDSSQIKRKVEDPLESAVVVHSNVA